MRSLNYNAFLIDSKYLSYNQMFLLIQYVFLFLLFVLFSQFVLIKLYYPFWSCMPVHHSYNYLRRAYLRLKPTNYKIQNLPQKNKYYMPAMKTIQSYDASPELITDVCRLLQDSYISSEKILFTIQSSNLSSQLTGHFISPYITYFYHPITHKLLSTVVNIPYHIFHPTDSEKIAYLNEYQCVKHTITEKMNPDYDAKYKYLSEYTTATNHYLVSVSQMYQNNKTSAIGIYISYDGSISGIIPICEFTVSLFLILPKIQVPKYPATIQHKEISRANIHILQSFYDLFGEMNSSGIFSHIIYTNLSALKTRIDAHQTHVYALTSTPGDQILALYIFEDAYTLFETIELERENENSGEAGRGKTYTLKTSYTNLGSQENTSTSGMFYGGFLLSLNLLKKKNLDYNVLIMNNLGHNQYLWNCMKSENKVMAEKQSAMYYLNYVDSGMPFSSGSVLFI